MYTFFKKIHTIWENFWFAPDTPHTIGLLRIILGFISFWRLTSIPRFATFGDMVIAFPNHFFTTSHEYFLSSFHDPVAFFSFLPVPSFQWFGFFETTMLVLSILFMIGVCTKYTGRLLAFMFLYKLLLSQFFLHHDIYMLLIGLFLVSFSPYVSTYSIDALLFKKQKLHIKKHIHRVSVTHMIAVMLTSLYFFGFLGKFLNPYWRNGVMLNFFSFMGAMKGDIFAFFMQNFSHVFLVYILFGAYLFLIFGFWDKRTKLYAFIVAFFLHMFIGLFMGIWIFGVFTLLLCIVHFPNVLLEKIQKIKSMH